VLDLGKLDVALIHNLQSHLPIVVLEFADALQLHDVCLNLVLVSLLKLVSTWQIRDVEVLTFSP